MHFYKYKLVFVRVLLVLVYGIPFNFINAHLNDLKTGSNVALLGFTDDEAPFDALTEALTKARTANTKKVEQLQMTTTSNNNNALETRAKTPTNAIPEEPGQATAAGGGIQPNSRTPYGFFIATTILLVIVVYFYCICKYVSIYSRAMFNRHKKRKDRLVRNI